MYAINNPGFHRTLTFRTLHIQILVILFIAGSWANAAQDDAKVVEVMLGNYRFMPGEIQLIADKPAILRLVNTDSIIPHNFTIEDANGVLEVNADVLAGEIVDVKLTPSAAGRYTFYCGNKLMFMKSHRERGMEGTLIVVPQKL